MSQPNFSSFFVKLRKDEVFRARFVKDPAATLKAEGIDASKLDIPTKIDASKLDERLDLLFSERDTYKMPSAGDVERMSAEELWDRFSIIKGATGAGADVPIVTAVVAYGAAVAVGTQAVVVGRAIPERRFAVRGPQGHVLEDLTMDEVVTLFRKMRDR